MFPIATTVNSFLLPTALVFYQNMVCRFLTIFDFADDFSRSSPKLSLSSLIVKQHRQPSEPAPGPKVRDMEQSDEGYYFSRERPQGRYEDRSHEPQRPHDNERGRPAINEVYSACSYLFESR